jgi:hypothetical protein
MLPMPVRLAHRAGPTDPTPETAPLLTSPPARNDMNRTPFLPNTSSRGATLLAAAFALVTLAAASTAHAGDPNGALRFVPASASTLLVVDVAGTVNQPFVKAMRKEILDLAGAARDVQKLKRDAGVDVFADVQTMIYAGTDKAVRKSGDSLIIVGGKFDEARLAAFYAKRGKAEAKAQTHDGRQVWHIGGDSWLAVVDGHALIGDKDLVKEALKPGNAGPAGALAAALPPASGRRGVWGAIVGSGDLQKILGKAFGALKNVKSAHFTLSFAGGIALAATGTFADAGAAQTAAKAIAGELDGFRKDPELKELGLDPVFDGFQATPSGTALTLKLNLTAAVTAELSKSLKSLFE